MCFDDLRPAQFQDLSEDGEFWKPLLPDRPPRALTDLCGPFTVYTATGHVLKKLFDSHRQRDDHEMIRVAFDPVRRDVYLMDPADIVYVPRRSTDFIDVPTDSLCPS